MTEYAEHAERGPKVYAESRSGSDLGGIPGSDRGSARLVLRRARGKAYLEKSKDSPYKNHGLGMMYAEGLDIREDIEQGVVCLKRAAWAN